LWPALLDAAPSDQPVWKMPTYTTHSYFQTTCASLAKTNNHHPSLIGVYLLSVVIFVELLDTIVIKFCNVLGNETNV